MKDEREIFAVFGPCNRKSHFWEQVTTRRNLGRDCLDTCCNNPFCVSSLRCIIIFREEESNTRQKLKYFCRRSLNTFSNAVHVYSLGVKYVISLDYE